MLITLSATSIGAQKIASWLFRGRHSHRLYTHSCDRTQSTVKPPELVESTIKAAQKDGQRSDPSAERTQITVLQYAPVTQPKWRDARFSSMVAVTSTLLNSNILNQPTSIQNLAFYMTRLLKVQKVIWKV